MKKCVTCLEWKEEEEFNWRYKKIGVRSKICRDCQRGHQRTWYLDHKDQEKERVRRNRVKARELARDFAYVYKLTHPCSVCGESDPVVLDFDHIKGKGANINQLELISKIPLQSKSPKFTKEIQ